MKFGDNLIDLHESLVSKTYQHGGYSAFKVNDPKPRDIHKASVRDRLVHHALYRILYPFFHQKFIHDSYSCRFGKGTHKAMERFRYFADRVSDQNRQTCWILKCDIRKFFASIDHAILKRILAKHIDDTDVRGLLGNVIDSFHAEGKIGVGLPLGNLTSQLLVNIYMNEFDHFVKRELKAKHYIRYADDFVVLHEDKKYLETLIPRISLFLGESLKLSLHPDKLRIQTYSSGVDFLGWIHFPYHRMLRTVTKWRMVRRLETQFSEESLASYLGILSHGDTHGLREEVKKKFQK